MTLHIHATTQFWGPPQDTTLDTQALANRKWTLTENDHHCFECPLPDCDQLDPQCVFAYEHHERRRIAKAIHRQKSKWQRELDEAVERILAEREAECATSSQG